MTIVTTFSPLEHTPGERKRQITSLSFSFLSRTIGVERKCERSEQPERSEGMARDNYCP